LNRCSNSWALALQMVWARVCGSIKVYSLASVRRAAPRCVIPRATCQAVNPIRVMTATLLNNRLGKALVDSIPPRGNTRVPYNRMK